MTSNYCGKCVINWAPYMTVDGACPVCGGGTVRKQEPMSADAVEAHKVALKARISRERHEAFEVFYADREAARMDAALAHTEAIDVTSVLRGLAVEPEQHGEVGLDEAA